MQKPATDFENGVLLGIAYAVVLQLICIACWLAVH